MKNANQIKREAGKNLFCARLKACLPAGTHLLFLCMGRADQYSESLRRGQAAGGMRVDLAHSGFSRRLRCQRVKGAHPYIARSISSNHSSRAK
jgi:hypothetical protein